MYARKQEKTLTLIFSITNNIQPYADIQKVLNGTDLKKTLKKYSSHDTISLIPADQRLFQAHYLVSRRS